MSDSYLLRTELDALNAEALELDAHIMSLCDSESSEHSMAVAAALFALGDSEEKSQSVKGFSKESIQYLIEPSRFETIAYQARLLEGQIEQSRVLSERVSRTVRQLDEAQMNVQQGLALVEDVVNLKGCANGVVTALKEDDLIGATGYVRQFHDIASVAAKASDDYSKMVESERDLQSKVMERFSKATSESGDADQVARYCALLGPLGLSAEGVKGYLSFARREIASVIQETRDAVPATGDLSDRAGETLQRLFNGAASFLQTHVAVCGAALSQSNGGPALLQLVHHDIEEEALKVVREYIKDMDLMRHCAAPPPTSSKGTQINESHVSINELNEKLEGVALIIQHAESYDRFVRHKSRELEEMDNLPTHILPPQTKLNEGLAELSGFYTLMEGNQLKASVTKALRLDDLPLAAQSAVQKGSLLEMKGVTTSAVQDSLYVCQCSLLRAVASGHPQTAAAVFNHVNNLLESELYDHLVTSAGNAASSLGKSGDMSTLSQLTGAADNASSYLTTAARSVAKRKGGDDEQRQAAIKAVSQRVRNLASLNNLDNGAGCILKLKEDLLSEVGDAFEEGPNLQNVLSCANELATTASKFKHAGRDCIEALVSLLRPALRAAVEDTLPSEQDAGYLTSNQGETGEEWVSGFLDKVLLALNPVIDGNVLSSGNDIILFTSTAEFISKRIEASLRRLRFDINGSLIMEKDIRGIVAFFAARAGRDVRSESFLRLRQFLTLLTVDALEDVEEMWMETDNWQLTPDEAKKVMSLRVDFKRNNIDKLSLRSEK